MPDEGAGAKPEETKADPKPAKAGAEEPAKAAPKPEEPKADPKPAKAGAEKPKDPKPAKAAPKPEEPKADPKPAKAGAEKPKDPKPAKAAPKEKPEQDPGAAAEAAALMAEKAEAAAKKAIEEARIAKEKAEAAAEAQYKAIADEVKAGAVKKPAYTDKRTSEEIFRRQMGEPEFFLDKKDRFPRPILSAEEQEKITRKAEVPENHIPEYVPEHVLSPEFGGMSNYERGVTKYLEDARARLEAMRKDPEASPGDITRAEDDVSYLESLHENYYLGMNVFRTAKGGRTRAG